MLFNSNIFIFAFLPLAWGGYYLLARFSRNGAKVFLSIASAYFYAYFKPSLLLILLAYIVINYCFYLLLIKHKSKLILALGIAANCAILGYFKYKHFVIENINLLFSTDILNPNILLPLGISFITFQQIAFLADCYAKGSQMRHALGKNTSERVINFALFVAFFPQLIAGPIVHYKDMMPQFCARKNFSLRAKNIALGLAFFAAGLAKKVLIADYLGINVDRAYSLIPELPLNILESWVISHAYTFQLYYDFSGYCDMAMGLALLFNIRLPFNFCSPYKSLSVAEFWRRWHMSLGEFLKHYVYIPLGGSKCSAFRVYVNLFIVFLISGIWHGAGWGFIIWGCLHGLAVCFNRFYARIFGDFAMRFSSKIYRFFAWFMTFEFINFSWIYFRAPDLATAHKLIAGHFGTLMISENNAEAFSKFFGKLPDFIAIGQWGSMLASAQSNVLNMCIFALLFAVFAPSSKQFLTHKSSCKVYAFLAVCAVVAVIKLNALPNAAFLYFNF